MSARAVGIIAAIAVIAVIAFLVSSLGDPGSDDSAVSDRPPAGKAGPPAGPSGATKPSSDRNLAGESVPGTVAQEVGEPETTELLGLPPPPPPPRDQITPRPRPTGASAEETGARTEQALELIERSIERLERDRVAASQAGDDATARRNATRIERLRLRRAELRRQITGSASPPDSQPGQPGSAGAPGPEPRSPEPDTRP